MCMSDSRECVDAGNDDGDEHEKDEKQTEMNVGVSSR
jgi:hypothetical protein